MKIRYVITFWDSVNDVVFHYLVETDADKTRADIREAVLNYLRETNIYLYNLLSNNEASIDVDEFDEELVF